MEQMAQVVQMAPQEQMEQMAQVVQMAPQEQMEQMAQVVQMAPQEQMVIQEVQALMNTITHHQQLQVFNPLVGPM